MRLEGFCHPGGARATLVRAKNNQVKLIAWRLRKQMRDWSDPFHCAFGDDWLQHHECLGERVVVLSLMTNLKCCGFTCSCTRLVFVN